MNEFDKVIENYVELPYRIEIVKIPDVKGGGFMARLPQFGRMSVVGDGESVEEALSNLEESKKALFEAYLSEGVEIPEPDTFQADFSGRFVLRIPKYLHKDLAHRAKENDVSLNLFATALLSSALHDEKAWSILQGLQDEIKMLRKDVCNLTYRMAPSSITLPKVTFEADDAYETRAA